MDEVKQSIDQVSNNRNVVNPSLQTSQSLSSNKSIIQTISQIDSLEGLSKTNTFIFEKNLQSTAIQCIVCAKYLGNSINEGSLLGGTLATGLEMKSPRLDNLNKGHNQAWYTFKNLIINHLKNDPVHLDAIKVQNSSDEQSKSSKLRSFAVSENHVRTAIAAVQMKSAGRHFETLLGFLNASGGDVGDIGHSRLVVSTTCRFCSWMHLKILNISTSNNFHINMVWTCMRIFFSKPNYNHNYYVL